MKDEDGIGGIVQKGPLWPESRLISFRLISSHFLLFIILFFIFEHLLFNLFSHIVSYMFYYNYFLWFFIVYFSP